MQTSSSNSLRFQPDDSYIISINSLTQPPKKEGCFKNHKVEKPVSNFSNDNLHELLTTDSNKKLLERYKSLRERIIKGLDHKFDGTEKTFIRNVCIKMGFKAAAIFFASVGSFSAMVTATTTLCPADPEFTQVIGATLGAGTALCSALWGYGIGIHGVEEYYLLECPMFRYFVDERQRKLFLKEVPESEDIKALEDLVGTIKDKLAPDQFDDTLIDMKKKFIEVGSNRDKNQVLTDTPLVFDIYLELAKQRYAKHHSANINSGVKGENTLT